MMFKVESEWERDQRAESSTRGEAIRQFYYEYNMLFVLADVIHTDPAPGMEENHFD